MAQILPFKRYILLDLEALLKETTAIHLDRAQCGIMEYLFELWEKSVHLKTFNGPRETTALTYAASGMQVEKEEARRLSWSDRREA